MQERNEDTLSLILDDPGSPSTFVFIFFVFFFPSRVPSPSVAAYPRKDEYAREPGVRRVVPVS